MDRYYDIQMDSKRGRRMFVKLIHVERNLLMLGRVVDKNGVPILNDNGKAEMCMFITSCIHNECVLTPDGLEPV